MMDESPAKLEASGRRCSGGRTRRRLVQSTLFPCKEPSRDGEDGLDVAGVGEEDRIEVVGSDGAGKKRKSKSLPRALRKASPGSKKSPRKSSDDGINVIPSKADFFLKASEKKLQQMQQKELERNMDCTVENGKSTRSLSCSPGEVSCWQPKENIDKINTGCKGRTSDTIGTPMGQQMSGTSLHLQSEANISVKMEDAFSSGGKQLHPFFTSWKVKKTTEIIDINDQDSDYLTCALTDWPLHVYEKVENEQSALDWKKWMLSERTIFDLNDSLPPINLGTSVFEDAVMPLNFDGLRTIRNVHEVKTMGPEGIEDDEQINENGDASNVQFTNHDDYSLWTTKYQPEKSLEVCGNKESVNLLSNWLRNWQEKLPQTWKDSTKQIGTFSWSEDDSDLEDTIEDSHFKNVFLITGPEGSGKSAAIYACAKEQGFEVIEVSASDCRNGSYVKQKFREAMESHSFNSLWQNNSMKAESAKSMEFVPSQPDSMVMEEVEDDVYEVVSAISSKEAQSMFALHKSCVEKRAPNKALILFEDVDTIFDEDRGFLGTIMQLAKTAKRPIILTSNRRDPTLPQLLDRLEVEFKLPSIEELLSSVYMVCAGQKAFTCPKLLRLVVKSCQADIRKTLMHLQFWLQGNHDKRAQNSQNLCPALQFDCNAWHRVLPVILPWEFPCELAKTVEKEISNALSVVREKNLNLVNVPIISNFFCYEDDKINLRKEAMLGMNMDAGDFGEILGKKDAILGNTFFLQNYGKSSSPFDNIYDSSRSVSASPVHFLRPTTRHNPNVIVSSDSEDDVSPTVLQAVPEDPMVHFQPKVSDQENNDIIEPLMNLVRSLDQNINMPEDDTTIDSFTVDPRRKMVEMSNSQDISCVPQSFVAETENKYQEEYLTGTVSSVSAFFGDDTLSYDLPFEGDTFYEVTVEHEKTQKEEKKSCDVDFVNAEEQGDSHVNDAGAGFRLCSVMDECSRVDIIPTSILLDNVSILTDVEIVDAAWGDLRRRENLQLLVNSVQRVASEVSKIVNGFTNVISEADIMFHYCQPVISDHLEQSLLPCHEPESIGWYDDQVEMCSTFAQHGFCFFAKNTPFMEPSFGCQVKVDIAREMLACSTSTMAIGKLITHEMDVCSEQDEAPDFDISLLRKRKENVYNSILPIIPSRFLLGMRGGLHDYSSCLSKIARFEKTRLSESVDGKHSRRARTARHYLNSGSLNFAPEDVDLFAEHGRYGHWSKSLC